jgi:hypothetical protein
MTEDDNVRRLLAWEQRDGAALDGATKVLAHPHFPKAARTLATNMLTMVESDAMTAALCRDAGRYVATTGAFLLHLTGGLTLPRLKALSTSTGFLSPGRARVILRFLEASGYVDAIVPTEPRRAVRYVPTPLFRNTLRRQHHAALSAAAIIEPSVMLIADQLQNDAAAEIFLRCQSETFLQGATATAPLPFMRVLLHRNAGSQFSWMLLAAGENSEPFPTVHATRVPIAVMSRRFGVSRVHLRRLLHDSEGEGLIELSADGGMRFNEEAHQEIRLLYAGQLAQLLSSAARTVRSLGVPPRELM